MLEFQSRPDRWMALRMLAYTALLWQKLVRSGELAPEDTLPPVLPVVLYNGERHWRAPSELTTLCYPAPPGLEAYQPQARYVLLDEKRLAASADGMQNLAAALFRLECSANPADFRQVAAEAQEWFRREASDSLKSSLNRYFRRWISDRADAARRPPPDEIDLFGEAEMGFAQTLDKWEANARREGLAQGLEQGIEQGLEQGLEQGQRQTLIAQLVKRFGPLSEAHSQRIADADAEQLQHWTLMVLDAEHIGDIFAA